MIQSFLPTQKPPKGVQLNLGDWSTKGLVGFWLLNEGTGSKVFDLSGNGNHGTFVGDVSWTAGKYGPAINFPGSADYINCGTSDSLNIIGQLTIVSRVTSTNTGLTQFIAARNGDGVINYALGIIGDDIQAYSGGGGGAATTNNILADNIPAHVVVTRDDALDTTKLYLNGVLDTTSAAGFNLLSKPGATFYMGIDPRDAAGQDFSGTIDYVMVYNRVLSASEIALLYREPFRPVTPEWMSVFELPSQSVGGTIVPQIQYLRNMGVVA